MWNQRFSMCISIDETVASEPYQGRVTAKLETG